MNAEFNWWLLIVGLVVGAGLVWLVVADSRRRDADLTELERDGEAQWITATMRDAGRRVDEADVLDVLRLHDAYLAAAPPDDPAVEATEVTDGHGSGATRAVSDDRRRSDERRWTSVPAESQSSFAPAAPAKPAAAAPPAAPDPGRGRP